MMKIHERTYPAPEITADVTARAVALFRCVAPAIEALRSDELDAFAARLRADPNRLAGILEDALRCGTIFDGCVLTELEVFTRKVEAAIEAGTTRFDCWEHVEECAGDPMEWIETHRTPEAEELARAFAPVRKLTMGIADLRAWRLAGQALGRLRDAP